MFNPNEFETKPNLQLNPNKSEIVQIFNYLKTKLSFIILILFYLNNIQESRIRISESAG